MPFIPLEKTPRLKNGYCRSFPVAGRQLLLIHTGGQSFAIDSICPHDGASLRKGRVSGDCIRCPKHGIHFSLTSGQPQGGEVVAEVAPLHCYTLVVRDDEIGVEIAD